MYNHFQSYHVFFVIGWILIMSLLDVVKQTHATETMFGVCVDVFILLSLPLSFSEIVRVLRLLIGENGGAALPQHTIRDRNGDSRRSELDFVALVGFAHTWLMFSRLLYVIFSDHSTFDSTIPIPLLFVFFHGPTTALASLLFTIVIYGMFLQTWGIRPDDWGVFKEIYLITTVPLKRLTRGARRVVAGLIALIEGFSATETAGP
ncbi:hypothetical protein FB446DRAFT_131573 [Lentinula raphanica]|nr:hypothetical protein FB446DRAFT_131573 [Lentinula raphanica]